MLSDVFRSTYLVLSTPVVGHPLPISWSGNLSNGFGINTTIIFFFQAEDGIRDCLLSRGLGDVYKRQPLDYVPVAAVRAAWHQW